jgi:serine/threonine-protein kinase
MRADASAPRTVGRYTIYEPIAAGGMASVHFGRLRGAAGFARTVAVKRLRSELAPDPAFVAMLTDEARLTSRIQHPNVVVTLDVVADGAEIFVVLEYVHGESLGRLLRRSSERSARAAGGALVDVPIAAAILVDALRGLHAAHEARGANGDPLELVHRDVSPQNVMIDVHGRARVLDFGVAKARQRETLSGVDQLKGKLRYMAPEQVHGLATPRSDLFAAAIVLWEMLTGAALFPGPDQAVTLAQVLGSRIPPPSERGVVLPPRFEAALMRALDRRPEARFATALDMASAITESTPLASADEVARWMRDLAADALASREARLQELDRSDEGSAPTAAPTDSPAEAASFGESAPRAARRGSDRRLFALAGGVAALLAFAWAASRGSDRDASGASPSSPPSPPSASSASSALASEALRAADGGAAPPVEPRPTSSAIDVAPLANAPSAAPPSPTRRRGPAPRTAPKPGCNPPFEFDAHGVKVYKRECFPSKR